MAEEERGGVQNVWLLLIAIGLGFVVALIYNVHINNVRQEGRGKQIRLLRVLRDIEPGERLEDEDLQAQGMPKQFEGTLGNVVDEDNRSYVVGQVVNRRVEKGQWLLWGHIANLDTSKPANVISKGNVAMTLPVDQKMSLGDILRQNDRVNVVGRIPTPGGLKTTRILRGVRVLAIGGEGIVPTRSIEPRRKTRRMRTYRSVTLELTPETAVGLANVLTHVSGECWVELLSSQADRSRDFGKINPNLEHMATSPRGGARAGGGGADVGPAPGPGPGPGPGVGTLGDLE